MPRWRQRTPSRLSMTKIAEDFVDVSGITIAAVERDTGLTKDTLRVWERRYGFPTPLRDRSGQRVYSRRDMEKLRLIKRLLDH